MLVETICSAADELIGLKHNWSRNAAVEEFFRGREVVVFNRNNHRTELSFTVAKQHSAIWAARQFTLRNASDVPIRGAITFSNVGAPASANVLWCLGALESGECYHVGVTTFQSYRFVGGFVTTTQPAGL